MRRPICSLCRRTGQVCVFPTERKRPRTGTQCGSSRKRSRIDDEPRMTQISVGSQGRKLKGLSCTRINTDKVTPGLNSNSSTDSQHGERHEIATNTAPQPHLELRDVESWTLSQEDYRHPSLPRPTQGFPEFSGLDTRLIDLPGEMLEYLPENDVLSDDLLAGFLWQSPESALHQELLAPSKCEVPVPDSRCKYVLRSLVLI